MASNSTFESPIPIENSRQVSALVVSGLCIFIVFLFVGLRLFAKFKTSKPFDASDICVIIALVFNTGLHLDMYIMVLKGGFSFHVTEVGTRFVLFLTHATCMMVFALLWNATTCFTKISVLLMYVSVFPVRRILLACRILGAFIIVWNLGGILGALLICRPFAKNWDQTTTIPGGKCGKQPTYYMALGVINILAEVTILALPFPILYKLQMPIRKKLVISGMFGVGFATCGVTIYRQATLPALQFADMTHSGLLATMFSGLEPSVALTLSCLPYLRPYFGSAFRNPKVSYNIVGNSSSNKGIRSNGSRSFEELNDDGSEIQLRPLPANQDIHVSSQVSNEDKVRHKSTFITVEKHWEVRPERAV